MLIRIDRPPGPLAINGVPYIWVTRYPFQLKCDVYELLTARRRWMWTWRWVFRGWQDLPPNTTWRQHVLRTTGEFPQYLRNHFLFVDAMTLSVAYARWKEQPIDGT